MAPIVEFSQAPQTHELWGEKTWLVVLKHQSTVGPVRAKPMFFADAWWIWLLGVA